MFIYLHSIPKSGSARNEIGTPFLISIDQNVSLIMAKTKAGSECTKIYTPYGEFVVQETLAEIANIIDIGGIRIANIDIMHQNLDMSLPVEGGD